MREREREINVMGEREMSKPRIFLVLALLILTGCYHTYPKTMTPWRGPVVRIELHKSHLNAVPNWISIFEFSSDNKLIGMFPRYSYIESKYPVVSTIYDLNGSELKDAVDAKGVLLPQYARLFPEPVPTLWRSRYLDTRPVKVMEIAVEEKMPLGKFKDHTAFRLSPDGAFCLLVSEYHDPKKLHDHEVLELWRLHPDLAFVWSVTPSEKWFTRAFVADFIEREGIPMVLAADSHFAYLLDRKSGGIVDTFRVDGNATGAELSAYARKLKPSKIEDLDGYSYLQFNPCRGDCNPGRHLLALGAFYGRRIRLFSLDPPYPLLFEANTFDNPILPGGGTWCVNDVRFVGGHYLIAEYQFAGRSRVIPCQSYHTTDIFDLDTWKRVWHESRDEVTNVTLSPDGKKLALLRGGALEIGDFVPLPVTDPRP